MWRWLFFGWWDQRRRNLDLQILWPSVKKQAPSLEDARDAFAVHMVMDPIYDGMTTEEIEAFVKEKLV